MQPRICEFVVGTGKYYGQRQGIDYLDILRIILRTHVLHAHNVLLF